MESINMILDACFQRSRDEFDMSPFKPVQHGVNRRRAFSVLGGEVACSGGGKTAPTA